MALTTAFTLALWWRRLAVIYERDTIWAYLLSRTQWTDTPFAAALVDGLPDAAQLARMREGIDDAGERLAAHSLKKTGEFLREFGKIHKK